MSQIIDKTQEVCPNLPGGEFLVYLSPDIPPNVTISKSNLATTSSGKIVVSSFGSFWGWSAPEGFCSNFETPEAALRDYLNLKKR